MTRKKQNITKLERQVTNGRNKLRRQESLLDTLLNTNNPEETNIRTKIEFIKSLISDLRKNTGDLTIELDDEDEVVREDTLSEDLIDEIYIKINQAESTLKKNPTQNTKRKTDTSKLPTLQLPAFSGDPLSWQHFWQTFENEIDSRTDISGAQKFSYLKGQLRDESLQIIAGLSPSNDNYTEAIVMLKANYDKPYLVREKYLKELFDLKCENSSRPSLKKFRAEYSCHLRGLKAMKEKVDEAGFVLVELLKWKLPLKIRDNMKRSSLSVQWTLDEFDELLEREIELLDENIENTKPSVKNKTIVPATTSSFGITTKIRTWKCRFCFLEHKSEDCKKFSSQDERSARCTDLNLCYLCLANTHMLADCRSQNTCKICNSKHHSALCKENKENPQYEECSSILFSLETNQKLGIALPTALLPIRNSSYRAFFDLGSQETLITENLFKQLKLKTINSRKLKIDGFESNGQVKNYSVVKLPIDTKDGVMELSAIVVKRLPPSIHMKNSSRIISILEKDGYKMADSQMKNDIAEDINIIVGADHYYDFIKGQTNAREMHLLSTPFGMMISGPIPRNDNIVNMENSSVSCFTLNRNIEDLWTLDTIGINSSDVEKKEDKTMSSFQQTIKYLDNKYEVQLPWKEDMKPKLQRNYQLAKGILMSSLRNLRNDPVLLKTYDEIIMDYVKRGFIEKIVMPSYEEDGVHFLPHHGIKRDSATTPLRVVFNCSAGKPSLNDCLETGPCLLNDLCQVLLRFRLNKFACIGDISKAFLMVQLDENDRNSVCFLWPDDVHNFNSPLSIYRFKVVLFGATCSPFLLNATITHHLDKEKCQTSKDIKRNIYVDNVQYNSNKEEDLVEFYKNSKDILKRAGMKLCEWDSNSNLLRNEIKTHEDGRKNPLKNPSILGMKWNAKEDYIEFPQLSLELKDALTKRNVLSLTSKLFDPLGILTPLTIRTRLFMQKIWKLKTDWDEKIENQQLKSELQDILEDTNRSSYFRINRRIEVQKKVVLHCFSDASQDAFGTVVYATSESGSPQFILSKARVTPLNLKKEEMTIPKLELTAASLSTRLVKFVEKTYKEELDIQDIYYWTDSKVVLNWIQNMKKLPKFETGRVKEIRRKSKVDQWHYVNTKQNPADLLSRGTSFEKLVNSKIWFNGPDWLKNEENWPVQLIEKTDNPIELESVSCPIIREKENHFPIDLTRFNSLKKAIKVTAYVLRWKKIIRKESYEIGKLTSEDLDEARYKLYQSIQNEHFREELNYLNDPKELKRTNLMKQLNLFLHDGLIRSRGRNSEGTNISWEENNPILLPYRSQLTDLLIHDAHKEVKHMGIGSVTGFLRQTVWIPKLKSRVKTLLGKCVTCKKIQGRSYAQPLEPPLPSIRVSESRPFAVTGVDYTGALHVKGPRKKTYIVLFTCAVTRAIHLELVDDNSASHFLLAFRRFVSRRSCPRYLISDNSTTFVASSRFLKEIQENERVHEKLTELRCTWKFIPSRAPWFGGWWERLIGITKNALKKILGKSCVSKTELATMVIETESAINNRPLTFTSSEFNDRKVLTPSDLIYGHRLDAIPQTISLENSNSVTQEELFKKQTTYEGVFQDLWQRWKKEYLFSLRERKRPQGSSISKIQVGDIVLIEEDVKSRMHWKYGRVTKLNYSDLDGLIRSAEVKTQNGIVSRPITKLYPLEMSCEDGKEVDTNPKIKRKAALDAMKKIKG